MKTSTKHRSAPADADKVLEEFKQLFKAARKELYKAGRLATADGPAYQAALAFARKQQIPGAETLLAALLAVWTEKDKEAALASVSTFAKALPQTLHGHALHVQGLLLSELKRYDESIACYDEAAITSGYDTPGVALYNAGTAYVKKGEFDRAIAHYQKALNITKYHTPGDTFNALGNVYSIKGEHARALEFFRQALASEGYDVLEIALNNMGNSYAATGEYDLAIECYKKALKTAGLDSRGKVLCNMGGAYAYKGDYDLAIRCCRKALKTRFFDVPGKAFNIIGSAYSHKDEHEHAIESYQKALETQHYEDAHITRNNIALCLRELGRHAEALAEVDRVLAEPDKEGEHARARDIRDLILQSQAGVQATVAEEALVKPESRTAVEDTPEQDMLLKLGYQEKGRKDKYDEYLLREVPEREDEFICLRGWSSAVTLLEGGAERQWSGGGYFLRWQGKGIVIDPGFDFMDNFHEAKLNLKEVDAVLVSHNHSDHNYDLSSLDDLRYELHRRWRVLKPEDQKKHDVSRCLFAIDEDTAKAFRDDDGAHRRIPVKFSEADSQRQRWLKRENDLPVTIEHFKVEHGADVPHAMGLRLRLHDDTTGRDFLVGYTGDTRWCDELGTHLKGCDVLLAHISMPAEEELLDDTDYQACIGKEKDAGGFRNLPKDGFKATHLGYRGMIELICAAKPKMVLVGEFWAGLADLRIDLVKGLRRQVKKRTGLDIPILPTGLGFRLRLPSLEVECTCCHKVVPHTRLKIAPAASSFGPLGYLCPKCLCE